MFYKINHDNLFTDEIFSNMFTTQIDHQELGIVRCPVPVKQLTFERFGCSVSAGFREILEFENLKTKPSNIVICSHSWADDTPSTYQVSWWLNKQAAIRAFSAPPDSEFLRLLGPLMGLIEHSVLSDLHRPWFYQGWR